ncbi:hypothetical protein D1AOALGA4SA_2840 [Olavius algarvensis Delta 1 endosymbiont]|nr:hypothetical protein D1AOALGA4SA_2840 [Olavius algarvensis Delta 1 endosymbiont]
MIRLAVLFGQRQRSYETTWNDECRMSFDECWNRFAQSILNGQNTLNPKSAFQNPKFAFGSFFSDQTGCPLAGLRRAQPSRGRRSCETT